MGKNDKFDRVDEFLLRRDSPRYFGSFSQTAAPIRSPQAYDYGEQRTREQLPPSSPTSSSVSSASRSSAPSSRYSGGSVSSRGRQSSISSLPSVAPPWQPPPVNQPPMAPFQYGYDLPCEFAFAGCHLRFHPEAFEEWIDHSISHFGQYGPCTRTVCSFCPREFDCSHNPNDAVGNWRRRMEHIGWHFYESRRMDGVEVNHPRPDFWILEYLNSIGRISPQDYSHSIQYTERPHCDNTYHRDWRSPEMLAKEERNSVTSHDLRKEKHHMRKEREKGSRTHRHRS